MISNVTVELHPVISPNVLVYEASPCEPISSGQLPLEQGGDHNYWARVRAWLSHDSS